MWHRCLAAFLERLLFFYARIFFSSGSALKKTPLPRPILIFLSTMAPMKSMKAAVKSLSKGGIADAVASETELKKSEVTKVLNSLANVAAKEVKKGKFVIPGVCMIKTRLKPATKAGKREIFGKMCVVKAKPAKTVVKAFPVAALKKSV